ncbi:hypothetical protein P3S67_028809 [Capsicum chacoense]
MKCLSLKEQCRELIVAKQDLIDKARATLVGNGSLLQKLQLSAGVPVTSDSDDPSYASFNQSMRSLNQGKISTRCCFQQLSMTTKKSFNL